VDGGGSSRCIVRRGHLQPIPRMSTRTWVETFEILEGTAAYRLGGEQGTLRKGEHVLMPARVPHVHPWNTGADEMVYRQTNDGATTPDAVTEVLGALATLHGLAREGRVGKRGLPKNPLQFVATGRIYTKHGVYDAAVPIPLQKGLAATFGRLAEALGYRGVHDRYLR
jgi:hypothetical protein